MKPIERDMMLGMISILNAASDAYYNGKPLLMSDEQFDARLADLQHLEEETGIIFSNSPTQIIGAKVSSNLPEVTHNHPMLSLEKCHSSEEVIKFSNDKELIASIKLDGMTASLLYEDGVFVRGESRGNGHVGNDITEHIKRFLNVPLKINKTGTYIIDGECIITDEDFAEINKNNEYKNSRNLIAGTLNSLDTSIVSQRKAKFIAWDIIQGGSTNNLKYNLDEARYLGFEVVPFWSAINLNSKKLQDTIDYIFDYASDEGIPTDGVVFKFDDIEYGKSLGNTSHHFRNGIAYKAKDDIYETKLLNVEFTMGKTGQLTPTAIFEPVEIDGTIVERASVHNISILTKLDLHIGDIIEVFKANTIIPQIHRNVSADERMYLGKEPDCIIIPSTCPVCGGYTEIKQDNDSKVLMCINDNCKGKLLGKLTHFCSKNAMDITGLSEATLEKFIEYGWLNSFVDIYNLKDYKDEMVDLDGFGEKSVDKLLKAIEHSKLTNLSNFIYALSIPLVGKSASKTIAEHFDYDFDKFYKECCMGDFDYTILDDFGDAMNDSMNMYMRYNFPMVGELSYRMSFGIPYDIPVADLLKGKVFVITGSLEYFDNRDETKNKIERAGGKVAGSVSTKTDFLVCNNPSSSSKYKKAVELNVKVISEEELIKMLKGG